MIGIIWQNLKNIRKDFLFATGAVILVMVVAFFVLAPMEDGAEDLIVTIPSGTGLYKIAQILKDEELIRSKIVFILLIVASGKKDELVAGDYELSDSREIRP